MSQIGAASPSSASIGANPVLTMKAASSGRVGAQW
jgi:hypothetical protein